MALQSPRGVEEWIRGGRMHSATERPVCLDLLRISLPAVIVNFKELLFFNGVAVQRFAGLGEGNGEASHFPWGWLNAGERRRFEKFLEHVNRSRGAVVSMDFVLGGHHDLPRYPHRILGRALTGAAAERWFMLIFQDVRMDVLPRGCSFGPMGELGEESCSSTGRGGNGGGDAGVRPLECAAEAVLNRAPLGMQYLDDEGVVLRANKVQQDMIGIEPREYRHTQFTDYFADLNTAADFFGRLRRGESMRDYVVELKGRDGEVVNVLVDVQRLRHPDGGGRYLCFCRNITSLRRQQLQILNNTEKVKDEICRTLHDDVGFDLMNLKFDLIRVQREIAESHPEQAAKLGEMENQINGAITKTRQLSQGLQPVPPWEGGLEVAISTLCRRIEKSSRIQIEVQMDYSALPTNYEVACNLYRIIQEAVVNAVKHGKAHKIHIRLRRIHGGLSLLVRNDGVPFPASLEPADGMGMRIMQFRAQAIGASLQVKRGKESGTCLNCILHQTQS